MPDAFSKQSHDQGVPESTAAAGRALVPLTTPVAARAPLQASRPDARFVVHLIATAGHVPQTRVLRRAAPGDVVTSYAARDKLSAAANGLTLSLVA
jgi:hypothetical protein